MTSFFFVKVKCETDNQKRLSRMHHYIKTFPKHFGDPPILSDARKKVIKNEIFVGGKKETVVRRSSRGIRFYLLKNDNLGQLIFLLMQEIFDNQAFIILPEDFEIDPVISNWYIEQKKNFRTKNSKANLYLRKDKINEVNSLKRRLIYE